MIGALAGAALALSLPGALAGRTSAPGVTASSILLGGTAPLSGPETAYAPVARGAQAYFAYVNAHGGVHHRKIAYRVVDDGYDPARTIQATRRLVQQDHVFAIFNSVGTEHVLAVRPFLNALHVPQLFVGSGAAAIATQHRRYPWTMGYLPSFVGEGAVYGRYVRKHLKRTTVAVLYENSLYGDELLRGLRSGLKGKVRIEPCTSITSSLPARSCRRSMFCVITARTSPRRSSSASARCAAFGSAWTSIEIRGA